LATFCWQNHYHVSVLLNQGCRILSRAFLIIQSLNLNYGKALIWQISMSQASRRQFPDSWKILHSLQLSKSQILSWPSGRPSEASGRPSIREDSEHLIIDRMNRSDATQCLRRFWTTQQTRLVKTICNRSDVRATPSERSP